MVPPWRSPATPSWSGPPTMTTPARARARPTSSRLLLRRRSRRLCQPQCQQPCLLPNRRHYRHQRRRFHLQPLPRRLVRHRCRVWSPRKNRHPSRRPGRRQCRPRQHLPLIPRPPRRPSRRQSTLRPRRRPIHPPRLRRPPNQPWFLQSLRLRRQRHRRRRPPQRTRRHQLRRQHQRRRAQQLRRPRLLKSSLL